MAEGDNNYVVGAGKLYFAPYTDATSKIAGAERYLGNTTAITRTETIDKLDHYTSDYAVKVKDATVNLQEDSTGTFTTDNIDLDNIALWFGAAKSILAQAAAADLTDTFTNAAVGRWYQLGRTDATPYGARKAGAITSIKVAADEAGIAAADAIDPANYTVDLPRARIFIPYESTDVTDETPYMEVQYSLLEDSRTVVVSSGSEQEGELRYIADNRAGDNNDYFWPDAKLTPNGDYALKGDTWAALQFNVEFLKKDDNTETQYVMAADTAS